MEEQELRFKLRGSAIVFPEDRPFCLVCGAAPAGTRRVWFEETAGGSGVGDPGSMAGRLSGLASGVSAIAGRVAFDAPLCADHRRQARLVSWGARLLALATLGVIVLGAVLTHGVKMDETLKTVLVFGPAAVPGIFAYLLWMKKDRGGLPCRAMQDEGTLLLVYPGRAPRAHTNT